MDNKKLFRIIRNIILIALATIIIIIIGRAIFYSFSVVVSGGAKYMNDYEEYYFYKNDYEPFFEFNFGTGTLTGYNIWVKPGQKERLLEKIKGDINIELQDLIDANNDIYSSYEINDDYSQFYIYRYKGVNDFQMSRDTAERNDKITYNLQHTTVPRIRLYHEIINGQDHSWFKGKILNFVDIDKE